MHRFWAFEDDMGVVEMVNFSKNLALLCFPLMFLYVPEQWLYRLGSLFS